jgi:2-amino-4-hydroxy-6-hydroxymethyldihydropteridine diphosphokinase
MSVLKRTIEQPAVIALGSNQGDRARTLADAVHELAESDGVELTAVSSFLETMAVRVEGPDASAPPYLNAVVLIRTTLTPPALLDLLHTIEQAHGRVRAERWGDRTLDLDIVDFAGLTSSDERLTLPHPRAAEREFVLRPWLEADPGAVLGGRRVADLLGELT